jgi:DNA repair protein SbcC/Rad50
MKLHAITLNNWRKHHNLQINFDEKATVIYGPNESGKSTILEGLSRGFFDRSSSSSQIIKKIKPLTSPGNVSSTVMIDFSLNSKNYHVEKCFNLRKNTSLFELQNNEKRILAEDESADEMIIEMLEADMPSTKGSKPSNWGAFQWLWCPQDNREIPNSKEDDPTKSLHLGSDQETNLLVTPNFQSVKSFVQMDFEKFFTKTGRDSSSSPLVKCEEDIQKLSEECNNLRLKIKLVEDKKQSLSDIEKELPSLKEKVNQTDDELKKAHSEEVDYSTIEANLTASKTKKEKAEQDFESSEQALMEMMEVADSIHVLQETITDYRTKIPGLEAITQQLERRKIDLREEIDKNVEKVRNSEELVKDARILYTKNDVTKKLEDLEKKREQINKIEEQIKELSEKELSIIPTEGEIEEINSNDTKIKVLRENLSSQGLSVNITPGEKGTLVIFVDGKQINQDIVETTGTERVDIESFDMGKVSVKANLDRAKDMKVDIERFIKYLKDILEKYNTETIDELKDLYHSQTKLKGQIKELKIKRNAIDERLLSEIEDEINFLGEKLKRYDYIKRSEYAANNNPLDTNLGALIRKREEDEEKAREQLDKARDDRDKNEDLLQEKKNELTLLKAEEKNHTDNLNQALDDERELIRKYGTIEYQEEQKNINFKTLKEKEAEYTALESRFEDIKQGPYKRIIRLEEQLKNQQKILQQKTSIIDQLKGAINSASLEGYYSLLVEKESRIEQIEEKMNKLMIQAESIKLLKESLDYQYLSSLSTIVGPIQEDVKKILSYVTGFFHDDVELNEFLFPIKLGERGFEDIKLDFSDSSSGLKEILALCIRFSVAKHLSKKESQCLVLDDPFIHVSKDRADRMIELMNDAIVNNQLQIIILTHRPMEFAGLSGKMIDVLHTTNT